MAADSASCVRRGGSSADTGRPGAYAFDPPRAIENRGSKRLAGPECLTGLLQGRDLSYWWYHTQRVEGEF